MTGARELPFALYVTTPGILVLDMTKIRGHGDQHNDVSGEEMASKKSAATA
ncbi:hypothetical protein [Paraburkholderia madseniana]|uniref:hypothetical protein n=1 Tax=Paraburkholderia madseniana TaxID=2599607 RepID=UPI0012B3E60A|nr:hypothetical protein [Paraburkholderia madseniana]